MNSPSQSAPLKQNIKTLSR